MWPTCAGCERGPRSPKKITSAGWSSAKPIRCERGTSPLIVVGRPAAEDGGEVALVGVGLELVDPPDEPRAVVAAARGDAERRLRPVGRAAPDVRHPDPADGGREDPLLPVGERGQCEGVGEALDARGLPVVEVEHLRGGVRRLGAGRRVVREQLERVLVRRVVEAQPEQSRDDLGAEAGGDLQAGGRALRRELARQRRGGRAPRRAGRRAAPSSRARRASRSCFGAPRAGSHGRRARRARGSGRRRLDRRRPRGRPARAAGRRAVPGRSESAAAGRRRDSRAPGRSAGRSARNEAASFAPIRPAAVTARISGAAHEVAGFGRGGGGARDREHGQNRRGEETATHFAPIDRSGGRL